MAEAVTIRPDMTPQEAWERFVGNVSVRDFILQSDWQEVRSGVEEYVFDELPDDLDVALTDEDSSQLCHLLLTYIEEALDAERLARGEGT